MEVRFLKRTKLTIQRGREEVLALYQPGDVVSFEEPEVFERLLKEGVAYPTHGIGGVVYKGIYTE